MFSYTPDTHESMTTSPQAPGQGHAHSHGQSQFLPGYLLGDHAPHGMGSPKLWSASNLSPGQSQRLNFVHTQHASSPASRGLSRSEVRGPPVKGMFSSSLSDHSLVGASPAQVRSAGTPVARAATPGPPTSGLLGSPTTPKGGELSVSQNPTLPISPTQLDPFYTQGESLKPDDILDETWITIFGFPPGATSFILQQFSQYGNILKHVPSAEGNWMHVHFQSKLQAKKALSKNGKVYGGRMMIGVLPCIDKNVMEDKENVTLASTPMTPQAVPTDLNLSARSMGTPIRPLTAAYTASRSEYEVLKNKPTPRKDQSIVSMVKEYMFGW